MSHWYLKEYGMRLKKYTYGSLVFAQMSTDILWYPVMDFLLERLFLQKLKL